MEPISKKDLIDALRDVATKEDIAPVVKDIKTLRTDLVSVEHKVSDVLERVNEIPTRGELGELIAKTYELSTLKANVARIMEHLHLS